MKHKAVRSFLQCCLKGLVITASVIAVIWIAFAVFLAASADKIKETLIKLSAEVAPSDF